MKCPAAIRQAVAEFRDEWNWYADIAQLRKWLWGSMWTLKDIEAELKKARDAGDARGVAKLTKQVDAWRARERKIATDDAKRENLRSEKRPELVASRRKQARGRELMAKAELEAAAQLVEEQWRADASERALPEAVQREIARRAENYRRHVAAQKAKGAPALRFREWLELQGKKTLD
jgi:hypothetical protein